MGNILDGVFIGTLLGFILSLPLSLFLAFWVSEVRQRWAVILGAFLGAVIGFLAIWLWAGTLINPAPLEGLNGVAAFFGSLLFCVALGLGGGLATDSLIARISMNRYRRTATGH